MRKEKVVVLRRLLSETIPEDKLSPGEIDALIQYITEVTKSEDEAIQRLSGILQNDLNGITSWQAVLQVELLREKVTDHQLRIHTLEQSAKPDRNKWSMVQAIFISITFIAATVGFLKAFGLLQFPWL